MADDTGNPGNPGPDPAEEKKVFSRGGVEQFRPKTGGMLNKGGTPGHRGAGGATPKIIREKLREDFMANVDILRKIAKSPKSTPAQKMKALELMVKYGAGVPNVTLDNQGDAIQPTLTIIEKDERASTADDGDSLEDGDKVPELPE